MPVSISFFFFFFFFFLCVCVEIFIWVFIKRPKNSWVLFFLAEFVIVFV